MRLDALEGAWLILLGWLAPSASILASGAVAVSFLTVTVGFRGGEAGEIGAGDMVAALASGSATEDTCWSGEEDVVVVRWRDMVSVENKTLTGGREGGREGGKAGRQAGRMWVRDR
jgi:hypothetical protein